VANPVAVPVVLTDDERERLRGWARRPSSAQALAMRSRIILASEGDSSNTQIAQQLGVARGMVAKWRRQRRHPQNGARQTPANGPRPGGEGSGSSAGVNSGGSPSTNVRSGVA